MKRSIVVGLCFLLIAATSVMAKELKIGYISSQRILAEFQESQEAQRTLDDEQRDWLAKAKQMEDEIQQMQDELKNQSLLMSEEKKIERQQEIEQKYLEYQRYQEEIWGDNGKLYQRNKELTRPIIDKVNAVIQKIGEDGGYDIIFDAAVGNIVYAKEDYDLTDTVLEDLNK